MSSRRTSTLAWVKEVFQADEHHRRIINKISSDRTAVTAQQPPPQQQQPINILVLAGGGAKGSALLGMGEGLQDLNGDDDFLQYFDLVCGTSIGGIGALLLNQEGTVAGGIEEARTMLEIIRKHSFGRLNWLNLFANGKCVCIWN
jgi:predicted acylesterase/phospholipase RssA